MSNETRSIALYRERAKAEAGECSELIPLCPTCAPAEVRRIGPLEYCGRTDESPCRQCGAPPADIEVFAERFEPLDLFD